VRSWQVSGYPRIQGRARICGSYQVCEAADQAEACILVAASLKRRGIDVKPEDLRALPASAEFAEEAR